MKKKYQVFISSTFKDLIEERKKITELLLMADCIPAGMESFVATDNEQFNVIKKVIDLCDYYILIIGNRYGSINETTSLSYTEMEYDYAISQNIPVLVFSKDGFDFEHSEEDVVKQGKLAEFKKKAMKNRLASVWKNREDLSGKVAISIMQAKEQIIRPGWIRDKDFNSEELIQQVLFLKQENESLKFKLNQYSNIDDLEKQSFYDYTINLPYTKKYTNKFGPVKINVEITLDKLYKFVSLRFYNIKYTCDFIEAISDFKDGYDIDELMALQIKSHYVVLGLITEDVDSKGNEILKLTEKGVAMRNKLNTFK